MTAEQAIDAFLLEKLDEAGQSTTEVFYLSDADDSVQPARFYAPDSDEAIPMVVALHSWSDDYKQTLHADIEVWCIEQGWAF